MRITEAHTAIITEVCAVCHGTLEPTETPGEYVHREHERAHAPALGYLVTCPQGCNLGTSAHQATREGAERRRDLHAAATTLGRKS